MADSFLHNHPDFPDLIKIVAGARSIDPALVEKDYWIMQCLYGLQQLGMSFELKGGTSLSKGYGIINRFSEDIDIRIEPPKERDVKTGRNQNKPAHLESRRSFFNWLAQTIKIDGIETIERDTEFDDEKFRSGGIRLQYRNTAEPLRGLRVGILLEVGFDNVYPNKPMNISSWAYDYASAADNVKVLDNRAKGVKCYDPGYTLVEKLQTISTKYRQQQTSGTSPKSFIRHYYDVYCLLNEKDVLAFIGTPDYQDHKQSRFRAGDNPVIAENEAFLLSDEAIRKQYETAYEETAPVLIYEARPSFDEILGRIRSHVDKL